MGVFWRTPWYAVPPDTMFDIAPGKKTKQLTSFIDGTREAWTPGSVGRPFGRAKRRYDVGTSPNTRQPPHFQGAPGQAPNVLLALGVKASVCLSPSLSFCFRLFLAPWLPGFLASLLPCCLVSVKGFSFSAPATVPSGTFKTPLQSTCQLLS